MHGSIPPPEHIKALRALFALAEGNSELEAEIEAFALAMHRHGLQTGDERYAEGLRQGCVRGRRRAKGLLEVAKRPGRPRTLDQRLKELGFSLDDLLGK
jgi:hypothetical protein